MITINRYKHIKRYKQIVLVFVRHGFGTLIDQLGILRHLKIKKKTIDNTVGDNSPNLTMGERLRLSLEELGPTFVKLGQIMSTRPDLLPQATGNLLRSL